MLLTSRRSTPRPTLLACALAAVLPAALAAPAPAAAPATPDDTLLPYTVTTHDTLIGLNHTLSVFGDVRIGGRAAAGAALDVGETIRTGDASTAVVQLADGSRVKLAPDTEDRLDEQRRLQIKATATAVDDGPVAAPLRLLSGTVEVFASKVLRARPLEVRTPTAVIGVRATVYRVRNDVTPATAAASAVDASATELLEGEVHAQVGASGAQSADVRADFGAPLEPGRKRVVLPLPPAPDLAAMPAAFDQLPIRFHVPGNLALRVQVADDAAFDHIRLDLHVDAGDEVRLPRLADGAWHLRARAISDAGLEGRDAVREFQLRARPESPFLVDPPANAKRPVGDVTLHWTHNPDAANYVVEVARDDQFAQLALRDEQVRGETVVFHPVDSDYGAADGVYWWRVVSVDASGRRGAWGDAQALILRPTPRAPLGRLSPDGTAIELSWGGNPDDRAEVELARDDAFQQIVARGDFGAPGGRLGRPAVGTYYARYRFAEPDGFRTAWSGGTKIEVGSNWHQAWRALLPDVPTK
jgi:hypothetical protein